MPSSTSDFTVNVNDVLYIDRWGISTLTEFNTNLNIQVWNQSPQPIYVKAVINDPNGNWKFNDDTTAKQLGGVGGFGYANFKAVLKRAVPSSDIEDEQFTITFEFYKDSGYATKIGQITKTITANIIDFHASPSGWTVNIDDFDDGTAQGWTLDLFTISDAASIQAGGYAPYYYAHNNTFDHYPSLQKNITIPSGVSKATLMFYWGAVIRGGVYPTRIKYVRVYINNELVYEDHVDIADESDNPIPPIDWQNVGIDVSKYAGQTITVKIEMQLKMDYAASWVYFKVAIDDIIFAYK